MLSSSNCLTRVNKRIYNAEGEDVFIETRTELIDKTDDYYVLSQPGGAAF